jgi:hypothetical protein
VDAGLSAASYGAFQILGENHKACGYATPFDFVLAMCQTEGAQLAAFVNFLKANRLDAAAPREPLGGLRSGLQRLGLRGQPL